MVQSAHKTLTSLSQTGFLHLNKGAFTYPTAPSTAPSTTHPTPHSPTYTTTSTTKDTVAGGATTPTDSAADAIHSYFSMLTTTSPNAVLLASLDATRAQFAQHGAQMVQESAERVNKLRTKIRSQGTLMSLASDVVRLSSPLCIFAGRATGILRTTLQILFYHYNVLFMFNPAHPFISLLEDSPEVRRRGLLVDPLRLSVRFHDAAQARDSVYYDDMLCEGKICPLFLQTMLVHSYCIVC